jgi:hypothetical protein
MNVALAASIAALALMTACSKQEAASDGSRSGRRRCRSSALTLPLPPMPLPVG